MRSKPLQCLAVALDMAEIFIIYCSWEQGKGHYKKRHGFCCRSSFAENFTRSCIEYSCFVNASYDKEKEYYSYDNINWFKGSPPQKEIPILELDKNEFVMGIEKESIIYDEESGLYFSWQPYYEQSFYSNRYETTLQDVRCNMIWVSTDAVKWVGISIPEDMLFFTGAGINESAKALIIDGAVEFTDDEKAFLDNEEKIASEQGLGYDKPWYKPEKYILRFSEIKTILE